MRRVDTLILILFLTYASYASSNPEVTTGKLDIINNFDSEYLDNRTFYVWLPDNFSPKKSFAVLYMHDGQMLFDARTTWNKQDWGVDEIAGNLIKDKKVRNFIVVGIDNAGSQARGSEYFPQNAIQYLTDKSIMQEHKYLSGNFNANNYLKFMVKELKPYLAERYGVKTDKANSFVAGSSMGGLMSMYAISEYPNEFAAAACISTNWPGSVPPENTELITDAILAYMQASLPEAGSHRLYFDFGTTTLDKYYPPLQARADKIIVAKGYTDSDWVTRRFEGEPHEETAWKARLHIPLLFLLGK